MRLISLTSDFGTADWFVGSMKAVILGIAPRVRLVDLAHGIAPGDIRAGALALMASFHHFPKGTVHLAVVDPGVGSRRAPIAVETDHCFFVGPDNGLLSLALSDARIERIHRLENEKFFRRPVSQTFHGRDIFAPVAAHLVRGVPLPQFGPRQLDYVRLEMRPPEVAVGKIRGEVIYIDRFGNAITNITIAHLGDIDPAEVRITLAGKSPFKLGRYYQEVPAGRPVGLINSSGFLEIAVNGGQAAREFHLKVGSRLLVRADKTRRPQIGND